MDDRSINDRFQSISYIILHFSCSLIELACALAVLALQITLTVTETCAFRIGVGFWSFPCLLFSPISIWILLWKRNFFSFFFTFISHIFSTLFATAVIIISFLTLLKQLGSICSTSSTSNNYFLWINISLIAVSVFLKIFLYGEIILLYFLRRHINNSSILFDKDFPEENYQVISNDKQIRSWNLSRSILDRNGNINKDFHI